MKILNEEHFENVKRYAESIGDISLQKCLERLKSCLLYTSDAADE